MIQTIRPMRKVFVVSLGLNERPSRAFISPFLFFPSSSRVSGNPEAMLLKIPALNAEVNGYAMDAAYKMNAIAY